MKLIELFNKLDEGRKEQLLSMLPVRYKKLKLIGNHFSRIILQKI